MLTWALAGKLHGSPVTANALNPGHVMTDLTRHADGLLKVAVVLTSFRAQTALDSADTAIWLAASPEVEGDNGQVLEQAPRGTVQVPGHGGCRAALETRRAADRSHLA
jgi:NAD(P)-dependent dehydrogenase (short-subunit alcohol dehydrogenase family)